MASRGGRDPDILFQPGGDVEVSKVKGNVYLVYGSAAPRGPFVNIDEVGGNLYLLDARHLDREMGADAVTRGALIRGMSSYQTSHVLGCLKIATPTCKEIIIVQSSFSSCKIGRVVGDFVPVNGHLPAFLSIQRWQGRFFSGVSEGMLPNPSLLFVSKTLKEHMNRGRLSPYANDTLSNRRKTLPARPPPLALPPASTAAVAPVTPRQDEPTTVKTVHESSPYLSEGEIPPGSAASQPPLRSIAPLPARRTLVLPFVDGVTAPATWTADPSTVSCGNCHHRGHQVRECIGPVDILGFIGGCPVCNSGSHYYEKCPITAGLPKALKDKVSYLMLCVWRQNKPPIRSDMCWVTIYRTQKSRHTLLPVPASESLQKFRNTWKDFNYKHCYGNPSRNDRVLPLNATVIPEPGSESRKEKLCKQKAADMAANQATEAAMTKTAEKQATKVTEDMAVKSTREAAAKAEKSLISQGTLAKAPNLKRKAFATPEEPKSDVKKQKLSFSPHLPHRPKQAPLSPSLESWAGDWLERTFTVKQENDAEMSGQGQVVRVKQEPRNE